MTRKRFQKLFRSEVTKVMHHQKCAGACIRCAANTTINNFNNCNSYQKAWDAVRVYFITDNNIPPIS